MQQSAINIIQFIHTQQLTTILHRIVTLIANGEGLDTFILVTNKCPKDKLEA